MRVKVIPPIVASRLMVQPINPGSPKSFVPLAFKSLYLVPWISPVGAAGIGMGMVFCPTPSPSSLNCGLDPVVNPDPLCIAVQEPYRSPPQASVGDWLSKFSRPACQIKLGARRASKKMKTDFPAGIMPERSGLGVNCQ